MCPCGGTIRPINKDWAQCDKCKDDTFPISDEAAGGEYGHPDQVVDLKFKIQQLGDEVERLRAIVDRQDHFCREFIWGEDEPHEYETQSARLASWRNAAIAMRASYAGHHPGGWPYALKIYAEALKIDSAEALKIIRSSQTDTEPLNG